MVAGNQIVTTVPPHAIVRSRWAIGDGNILVGTMASLTGHDPHRVTGVTTGDYFAGATTATALRPAGSVLNLDRLEQTGFHAPDGHARLTA
ncbi:hypothetical protein [Microbacterium laevaniformans]|uniref:hypothetical protein n=1 Tax=Microbacterium laevaniformans TaxID=36807 RepID=UPI003D980FAC